MSSITANEHDLMKADQRGWDKHAVANQNSSYYDLGTFRAGRSSPRNLARLGAYVTAVDFAGDALEIASRLAQQAAVRLNGAGSRRAGLLTPARGSDSSFLHLLRSGDVVIGYGGGHDA
jgi:hypothetical protein